MCWKNRLCFSSPLKGARAPSQDSHSLGQSCTLCANLQHCRTANSFCKLPVKLRAHPQNALPQGDPRETIWTSLASCSPPPSHHGLFQSTSTPALRVLCHGGSPRATGCTAPACSKFPLRASSALGEGGKREPRFFFSSK